MPTEPLETDPETGVQVYCLGADERPADDIYGEQPYGDATGRRIVIRYFKKETRPSGLSVIDLTDGARHDILEGATPFPAFHAWGAEMWWNQKVDGKLLLRRCSFDTLQVQDVCPLPAEMGSFSYGTVSPDNRYYAVSVTPPAGPPARVHVLDLQTGVWSLLLDKPGYHAKHEQFSRDGRNRVLIQLNQYPEVKQVLLGELEIGGEAKMFPADQPHPPRPTGHEAWIGDTARIFFSCGFASDKDGAIWTSQVGDTAAKAVAPGNMRFGHVSVSRDGKYWIADTGGEGVPIYIGSFASGAYKRAVCSRSVVTKDQSSHTHPYLTADNRWLIFNSTRDGHAQVYGARLADGWLNAL